MPWGTILSVGAGILGGFLGNDSAKEAARAAERERKKLAAKQEAWYNRNYYQDYLNSVNAQNAIKRYRDAWSEKVNEARARRAVAGGTPERAQAVAEAGGEAMGNLVGNLAAVGEQNKQAIDAQKQAMDANLAQQAISQYEAQEAAGANLMASGVNMAINGLAGLADVGGITAPMIVKDVGVKPAMGVPTPPKIELPKTIEPLKL